MSIPKFLQNITLLFILAMSVAAPVIYTNCGRAALGNLSSTAGNNSAQNTPGTAVDVGSLACPAGQAPVGIGSDRTIVCAPFAAGASYMCAANSSVYQLSNGNVSCVVNTSWDQPGAMCPVGSYLTSISSSGAITCVQPTLIVSTRPLNASCPVGQYLNGVQNDAAVCLPLPASVPTAFICPSGQYLNDLNGSTSDCRTRPWTNTAVNMACPAGTQALGWAADGSLVCKQNNFTSVGTTVNVSCASGQVLVGYANGAAVCKLAPIADVSHSCRAGYAATGISGGLLLCSAVANIDRNPCADGQFVVGLNAGQQVCGPATANHLPAVCSGGSYPVGVSNGVVVCVAFENARYPSSALACFPGESTTCAVDGGIGQQTCNTSGNAVSTCVATSCVSGRELANGACRALACQPGVTQACPVANGNGLQFCDSTGVYSACQIQACNNGYASNAANGGKCEAVTCMPSNTTMCSVAASGASGIGYGFQTCTSNGLGYGKCFVTSCQNGFSLKDGACMDTTSPRVTFQTVPMAMTLGSSATLAFSASDPETGLRSTICKLDGADYPACTSPVNLTNLKAGNHTFAVIATDMSGNSTKQTASWRTDTCSGNQTQSCNIPNGTGHAMCTADGTYGSCLADQCASGFEVKNGICQALNCKDGYTPAGNNCVDNTAPTIAIGSSPADPTVGTSATFSFAASDAGSGVGVTTCALDKSAAVNCASPLTVTNLAYGAHTMTIVATDRDGNSVSKVLSWRTYLCAPNQAQACGIANGVGAQSCMADGSGYSACQVQTCNSGFVQNMNQCVYVPKTCTVPGGAVIPSGAKTTAYQSATVPYRSTCASEVRTCNDGVLSGSYGYQTCAVDGAPPMKPVYRFYAPSVFEHFFSLNTYEAPMGDRYRSEGIGFYVLVNQAPNTHLIYRCLWNTGRVLEHFISNDPGCEGKTSEGPYGYVYNSQVAGSAGLSRFWSAYTADHLITANPQELYDNGNIKIYMLEGILGYAPTP